MRHQNKAILIFFQIAFEPFNMFKIKIIRRLVQNQDGRILQQQLCQQHLRPLAAAQIHHITIKTDIA